MPPPPPQPGPEPFADERKRIEEALALGLPGREAQRRMAPRPRPGWIPGHIPSEARRGAGLILLYPRQSEPHLLLTLRAKQLSNHSGQVSLPGGAVDTAETLQEAALREAREEVGAVPEGIEVLGQLSPLYIPISNFVLHPVLACCEARQDWHRAPEEVERILEVPLAQLTDPGTIHYERRTWRGQDFAVPYFKLGPDKVWGATAMVLAELLHLVGFHPQPFD